MYCQSKYFCFVAHNSVAIWFVLRRTLQCFSNFCHKMEPADGHRLCVARQRHGNCLRKSQNPWNCQDQTFSQLNSFQKRKFILPELKSRKIARKIFLCTHMLRFVESCVSLSLSNPVSVSLLSDVFVSLCLPLFFCFSVYLYYILCFSKQLLNPEHDKTHSKVSQNLRNSFLSLKTVSVTLVDLIIVPFLHSLSVPCTRGYFLRSVSPAALKPSETLPKSLSSFDSDAPL